MGVDGYEWALGDGLTDTITHPVHVYTTTGVYTVSLTASGPGGTDTMTKTDYVTVTQPTAPSIPMWWDDDFFYRQSLTVAVGQPLDYTPGMTIPLGLTLDTASLVNEGKLRGDGYDLRVAYWDGMAWEGLPRAVQGMGGLTSTVIFPLRATITNTDEGYYLYYGNAVAGEPPLLLTDTVTAGVTVTPGLEETSAVTETIEAALGGELLSADGRMRVTFPAGAVAETVLASHTPYRAVYPQPSETLARFDLEVETLGGQPVPEFLQPVTLTFDYSGLAVELAVEDTMTLYRWDEGLQEWQAISSTVDTQGKRLTAVLDHFSGYAIATAQAERRGAVPDLPATVAGFQSDLFTGAATFVYPIQVAPGTARMQPTLSLSYSSLAADQGWAAQASWTGFGFNLDAGYIARDANDTPNDLSDDTFHLVLNGVSSKLVEESPDVFHTEQETYWRIRRHSGGQSGADNGQYWVVTDTNGIEYRFGYTADAAWNSLAWVPGVGYEPHTYRYNLDRVRDVHGNTMTFEYEKEQEWLNDPPYVLQYDRAGYLLRIRYTGNDLTGLPPQREVVFYTTDREVTDYPDIYAWGPLLSVQHFFLTKQLEAIEVLVDGQRVRRYVFGYHHENGWGNAYVANRLLLDSVAQLGSQGDTPLITTNFTYYTSTISSDWQRLKEGSNSYGASVAYQYDSIKLEDSVQRVRVVQRMVNDGQTEHVYGYYYNAPAVVEGEFRGHCLTQVTLPNGERSIFNFHQGTPSNSPEPLKGRVWMVQKQDDQGETQSIQRNTWQYRPTGGGANFVYLEKTITTIGSSSPIEVRYLYDEYGNLVEVYEPGDPSTTTDDRYRVVSYTLNTEDWIVNRPRIEEVRDYTQNSVARTEYYYDHHPTLDEAPERGDLTKVVGVDLVNGNNLVTEYNHDAYGNVTDVTDGRGHTTMTAYDTTYHTFPETVTYPLPGFVTTAHYDARFGLVEWATDLNGQTTHYEYDTYGRLQKVWTPLDYGSGTPTVEYVYTPTPSILEVQTRRKEAYGSGDTYDTVDIYNGLGQLVQARTEGEGGSTIYVDYQYDGLGRQWKVSAPYTDTAQLWTETTYDDLGRVEMVTHTDGTYRQYFYTGWERVVVRDENGHYKGYNQDAFGRTVQVDEYTDGYPTTPYATTHYTYDLLGNLTGVEDGLGHTTVITYDSLGRKLAMDDPDMGDWSYGYDANGNLATQTDASGTVITFSYDEMNRLVSKSYSNGDPMVIYIYDAGTNGQGRRTGMADVSGTTEYIYDTQGRLLTETRTIDGVAYRTGFTYDPMDRVRTMTYPDGEVITYDYNAQGLLESMVGLDAYVGNVDYNALGQTTRLELGNGLVTNYDYHQANFRLESIVTTGGLQNLNYTYDNVGNVQTMVDSVGGLSLTYGYDELDRLTDVSGSYSRSYGYDTIGNLTDKNGLTLEYNDPCPHAVSGTSEGWSLDYGPTGNLITRTVGSQVVTFGYDAENRLTQVISGTVTTFVYDGDGRRVKKVDENGMTVYVGQHYEVRYENVPWQELFDEWQSIADGPPRYRDFQEFKGNLYTGGYEGAVGRVYRLADPDLANQWERLGEFAYGVATLASWENYLWLANGSDDLYRSSDGENWEWLYDAPAGLGNNVFAPGDGRLYYSCEDELWTKTWPESDWAVVYDGGWGHAMAMGPDGLHMGTQDHYCIGYDCYYRIKILRRSGSGWVTEYQTDWSEFTGSRVKDFVLADGMLYATVTGEDRPLKEVNGVWVADDYPVVEGEEPNQLEYYGSHLLCSVGDKLFVREEGGWTEVYAFGDGIIITALEEFNGFLFVGTSISASWRNAQPLGSPTKHYYANGQWVATRVDGSLYYVHGDLLGSTVAVSDAAGQAVGRVQYDPYGEVLTSTLPVTLTERLFTGQRLDSSSGLYYYNARYYDPHLGRFVSADTLVPNPGNPQDLNRYAYVRNNPLIYTDPSGHAVCLDDACHVVLHPVTGRLMTGRMPGNVDDKAQIILQYLGGVDDLEALSQTSDLVASYHPTDWGDFLPEMGRIFIGVEGYGPGTLLAALFAGGCGGIGREPRDCPGNKHYFLDEGFHKDFRDRHNQPYHAWGYIAQTAAPGSPMAYAVGRLYGIIGNIGHEYVQSKLNIDDGWGTSWQDYTLSESAMAIGLLISIEVITPAELGDVMRYAFGPEGPGSGGTLQRLEERWGPLRGSPQ